MSTVSVQNIAVIGILNGVTVARTGHYPLIMHAAAWHSGEAPEGLFDEEVRRFD
ncbi:MAG: hypothetical protein LBJ11_09540 [Oscillospiraceae bacterium]|jgi:hypothetical protein|nr:hypothetical protein [Oscillospiraceae bacterium]